MTLTPSSVRADLKCGRGSISPGEKCSKGPATKAGAPRGRAVGRALAKGAGKVAMTAGAAMMGGAMFNFKPGADPSRQWARGAALMGAGSGLHKIGEGKTKAGLKDLGAAALSAGVTEGGHAALALYRNRKNKRRETLERIYRGPSANRGDSVWAAGFEP